MRLRVEILAQVNDRDRRVDTDAGWEVPSADRAGFGQCARVRVDHWPQPQCLCHDGIEVCVVVGGQFFSQASKHAGIAQQQVEGEGEAGGGRLVTGEEQRHQLVTKLHIGHRLIVLVAGAQQQRENIGAVLEVRLGAAEADLLVDQRVRRLQATLKLAPRAPASDIVAQHVRQEEHGLHIEHGDQGPTQPFDAVCVGYSEDGADDHLEGERPRIRSCMTKRWPSLQLPMSA